MLATKIAQVAIDDTIAMSYRLQQWVDY